MYHHTLRFVKLAVQNSAIGMIGIDPDGPWHAHHMLKALSTSTSQKGLFAASPVGSVLRPQMKHPPP